MTVGDLAATRPMRCVVVEQGAAVLAESANTSRVDNLRSLVYTITDGLRRSVDATNVRIGNSHDGLSRRIDAMDSRVSTTHDGLVRLIGETRSLLFAAIARVQSRVDAVNARVDKVELAGVHAERIAVLESELARLTDRVAELESTREPQPSTEHA